MFKTTSSEWGAMAPAAELQVPVKGLVELSAGRPLYEAPANGPKRTVMVHRSIWWWRALRIRRLKGLLGEGIYGVTCLRAFCWGAGISTPLFSAATPPLTGCNYINA